MPLMDLREIFGVWERCPDTAFWRQVYEPHPHRPDQRLYLNPIKGVMIVAREHLASKGMAYEVFVRSAENVTDEQWQAVQARLKEQMRPWIWNALSGMMAMLMLVEVLRPDPGSKLKAILDYYKKQDKEFLETGRGHQDPGLDELLAATRDFLVELEGAMVLRTTILKDDLPEYLESWGIREC